MFIPPFDCSVSVILSSVVPLLACDYEESVSQCPSLYGPLEELTRGRKGRERESLKEHPGRARAGLCLSVCRLCTRFSLGQFTLAKGGEI